jgi:hypothetical protein
MVFLIIFHVIEKTFQPPPPLLLLHHRLVPSLLAGLASVRKSGKPDLRVEVLIN